MSFSVQRPLAVRMVTGCQAPACQVSVSDGIMIARGAPALTVRRCVPKLPPCLGVVAVTYVHGRRNVRNIVGARYRVHDPTPLMALWLRDSKIPTIIQTEAERRRREAGVKQSMEIRVRSCMWVCMYGIWNYLANQGT